MACWKLQAAASKLDQKVPLALLNRGFEAMKIRVLPRPVRDVAVAMNTYSTAWAGRATQGMAVQLVDGVRRSGRWNLRHRMLRQRGDRE